MPRASQSLPRTLSLSLSSRLGPVSCVDSQVRDSGTGAWTLRKCAASTLVSCVFKTCAVQVAFHLERGSSFRGSEDTSTRVFCGKPFRATGASGTLEMRPNRRLETRETASKGMGSIRAFSRVLAHLDQISNLENLFISNLENLSIESFHSFSISQNEWIL